MRVLIVEDEKGLAESMRRGLIGEGCVVEVAHDGITGLWAATEASFDVVILDIMLPQLNGYKVLEQLRDRKIWTPVLMLTAKDGEYDQTDAFDLGADDYLTKPFSFIVLVARLRALVRPGAPERPTKLTVGTLVLDPARRTVTRRGETLKLTAREFALVHYLMRNAGSVVGKFDILHNVWDPGLRRQREHRRGLHGVPAPQARRPLRAAHPDHYPRHGLPPRLRPPREEPDMIPTLAVLVASPPSSAVTDITSDSVTVAAIIGLAIILIVNMIKESVGKP